MGKKQITTTLDSFIRSGSSIELLFSLKDKSIRPQIKVRIGLCAVGVIKVLQEARDVFNKAYVEEVKKFDPDFVSGEESKKLTQGDIKAINEKMEVVGEEEVTFYFNPISPDDISKADELSVMDIGRLADCGILTDPDEPSKGAKKKSKSKSKGK